VDDPWIGDGRARVNHADVRRALFLFFIACLLQAAMVGSLALGRVAAGL
jgi:adenosylcobinamide-phosphate synthase